METAGYELEWKAGPNGLEQELNFFSWHVAGSTLGDCQKLVSSCICWRTWCLVWGLYLSNWFFMCPEVLRPYQQFLLPPFLSSQVAVVQLCQQNALSLIVFLHAEAVLSPSWLAWGDYMLKYSKTEWGWLPASLLEFALKSVTDGRAAAQTLSAVLATKGCSLLESRTVWKDPWVSVPSVFLQCTFSIFNDYCAGRNPVF